MFVRHKSLCVGCTGLTRHHRAGYATNPGRCQNERVRTHAVACIDSTPVSVNGTDLELLKCVGNGGVETPPVLVRSVPSSRTNE